MDNQFLAFVQSFERPQLRTVAELLKPITWFPPVWAFACGAVASGQSLSAQWPLIVLG